MEWHLPFAELSSTQVPMSLLLLLCHTGGWFPRISSASPPPSSLLACLGSLLARLGTNTFDHSAVQGRKQFHQVSTPCHLSLAGLSCIYCFLFSTISRSQAAASPQHHILQKHPRGMQGKMDDGTVDSICRSDANIFLLERERQSGAFLAGCSAFPPESILPAMISEV